MARDDRNYGGVDPTARGIARNASVGPAGPSAYEVAVTNGFVGTQAQWLASLVGGVGATGQSAYQLAVTNGFVGNVTAWLASLVGPTGAAGNTVLNGTAAPTTEGVNGDFYVQLVSGVPTTMYGPKAAGLWPAGVSIRGPQGIQGPSGANASNELVSGGQVNWTGTGFVYRVSAAQYYINGAPYTSVEQTITLNAADATNPRFDVIALDTTGTVVKITGTPAANPSEPDVDPATQLQLAFVQVNATATTPPIVTTNEIVYEEDDGVGEWPGTVTGAAIAKGSTTNPRTGSKCIRATSATSTSTIRLDKGSTINRDNFVNLVFFLRSALASWGTGQIRIHFQNAAGQRIGNIQSVRSGSFGFDSTNLTTYQQVVIPLSTFAIPAGSLIEFIHITSSGGAISYGMDDIGLTPAGSTGGSGGTTGITQAQADALYKRIIPNIQNVVSAATVTPTFLNDQVNITAQAAALNLANPTGTPIDGWAIAIRIKDNGTARAITYGTKYRIVGTTLPTTTVINKTVYICAVYNLADDKWDVVAVAPEA